MDYLLTADPSLTSCFSSSCAPALLVSHVVLGSVQSRAGASLQASLTTSGCLPEKPLVSAEGTEALSPCCLSEKAAFTPKLQAVNCESRDLWRGEWQRCTVVASPPLLLLLLASSRCPASATHTGVDNMAATGRNLLLESGIKATDADRNLLSNTHKVDANRKKRGLLSVRSHAARGFKPPLLQEMLIYSIKRSNEVVSERREPSLCAERELAPVF